jgi:hypothetical protein
MATTDIEQVYYGSNEGMPQSVLVKRLQQANKDVIELSQEVERRKNFTSAQRLADRLHRLLGIVLALRCWNAGVLARTSRFLKWRLYPQPIRIVLVLVGILFISGFNRFAAYHPQEMQGGIRHRAENVSVTHPYTNVSEAGFIPGVYRQGRDAREGYAVLSLLACYFACAFGAFWGTGRIIDGHRWSGIAIFILAVAIGLAAAITGASGCPPWQWERAFEHNQKQTEYRQEFPHDGGTVSRVVPPASGRSRNI